MTLVTAYAGNPERVAAFEAIDSERRYQDERWGDTASSGRPGSGERSIDEFATYISGYAHKLTMVCSESGDPRAKLEVVRKIAALTVACMEQHGAPRRGLSNYKSDKA